MDRCTCQYRYCLGPDPSHPEVRHRRACRVLGIDRDGPFAVVGVAGETQHRFLRIGLQIRHADARPGIRGLLEYQVTASSGLDYFRAIDPTHACEFVESAEHGDKLCVICGHFERTRQTGASA